MSVDTILYIAGGLGAGLAFFGGWAWNHTHKRIDDCTAYVGREVDNLSEQIEKKADNIELTRARDTQVSIFEQFRQHELEDRHQHATVLTAIGRLEGKMDALLARKRGEG